MIAIGIGLHNFGEGLAISAAVCLGKAAISTFIIIGFPFHNTTEGLAMVSPIDKNRQIMI
jgi:ZIP family zinc transporter